MKICDLTTYIFFIEIKSFSTSTIVAKIHFDIARDHVLEDLVMLDVGFSVDCLVRTSDS